MAKYDATKFYWLQLKEDFFEEDSIGWLEDQPNGKEYALFYLKLCLKSLKTNGILIRQVGEILVPYDAKKLAEITRTDFDTVCVAMELLKNIGLIKILENGELYLTQVEHMIGSQSKSAFKKQQQRLQNKNTPLIEGGQEVDKCPPDIDIELEIELDIEKENKKEKTTKKQESKKATYDSIIEDNIKSENVKNTLLEFIKMRKLIKKPLTDFALKKLCNNLNKLSSNEEEQVAILEQSIINNWQGIFPLKNEVKQVVNSPVLLYPETR